MDWLKSAVAVLPICLVLGHQFDLSDWQLWAIMAAASWWRWFGRWSDAAI